MIVGVTGPLCAGTDTFGEILQKEFGFVWLAYSDVLRDELRKRGIEITRKNLQDLGNELRETRGTGVISELLVERMIVGKDPEHKNDFVSGSQTTNGKKVVRDYVVGNIRNPGEVEVLREKFGDEFVLVRLDAEKKIRFERLLQRRREKDPQTWEEFLKVEARDFGVNEEKSGQQHSAVFEMADFVIENNGSFEELRKKVKDFIENINY